SRQGARGNSPHRTDPAAMLRRTRRGARALRVELPEAALTDAGGRAAGPPMGGAERAYLLARLPARASVAEGDHGAEPRRAADRRDRQGRRGVRGLSARAAVRLSGERSRIGNVKGARAARRDSDLESGARTVG